MNLLFAGHVHSAQISGFEGTQKLCDLHDRWERAPRMHCPQATPTQGPAHEISELAVTAVELLCAELAHAQKSLRATPRARWVLVNHMRKRFFFAPSIDLKSREE